jgi:hypothetical protein
MCRSVGTGSKEMAVCHSPNRSFARQGVLGIAIVSAVLVVLACPLSASPTLGKSEASVERDKLLLPTEQIRVVTGTGYRCRVLSSEKLTVKEYVNPATKVVFGVSWSGTQAPPLKQLLGFDPSTLKGIQTLRSLHFARIVTSNLIFEMSAIMGHYSGRAVRTDLLPKGVKAEQVVP